MWKGGKDEERKGANERLEIVRMRTEGRTRDGKTGLNETGKYI